MKPTPIDRRTIQNYPLGSAPHLFRERERERDRERERERDYKLTTLFYILNITEKTK